MATNITLVYTRGNHASLLRLLRTIPSVASGRTLRQLSNTLLVRVGNAALGQIKKAFIEKARGGSDVTGLRWRPLSPKTIAYKRRHPLISRTTGKVTKGRLPKPSVRAGYHPSYQLTKQQRERWWAVYCRLLGKYRGNKKHAAAVAWIILKSEGAKTLLEVYGNRPVEILRDTGLLLNSLSPGVAVPGASTPPRAPNQVFRLDRGSVIIGTSRKGAKGHQEGIPGRLPQRRLWPEPSNWNAAWWTDIVEQAQAGIVDITRYLVMGK